MTEHWKPVRGYEGLYEVSDAGRVRSLDRTVRHAGYGSQRLAGRVLRQTKGVKPPYYHVSLLKGGRQTTHRVHILVLNAFAGPRAAGNVGRHLNGDSFDNHLSNLAWGTQGENRLDSVRHGTHPMAKRTHCPRGHALIEPNITPAERRVGHRACYSCAKERWSAHDQHRSFDPTRADARYAELMGES